MLGTNGHCILESNQTSGALYLSDIQFANNQELLQDLEIKFIITVGTNLQVKINKNQIQEQFKISIYDTERENIKQYFKEATLFLKRVIFEQKSNILIHCHQGASRSVAIVLAFLMKNMKWSFEKSYSHVKRIRSLIQPNKGFINQLKQYEKDLGLVCKKSIGIEKQNKTNKDLNQELK